jgi:hypothetical protein
MQSCFVAAAVAVAVVACLLVLYSIKQFDNLPLQQGIRECMQFGICHCSTVTAECVHALWYPATAVRLLQSACMRFGILPLQYSYCRVPLQYSYCRVRTCILVSCHCSKVTAECVHAVWYPTIAVQLLQTTIAVQLLQSAYMHFSILPLQYGDCRVRACGLVSCHCSTVTAECVHAVWYPAIAVQLMQSAYMQFCRVA